MYRFLDYSLKYLRHKYFDNKYKDECEYLAAMIRFAGHSVESWAKRTVENPSEYVLKRAEGSAQRLKDMLAKYDSLGFENSQDIQWCRDILAGFENRSIEYSFDSSKPNYNIDVDDFVELTKSRRSIRKWNKTESLSRETIDKLINAAKWAPSSCNRQTIKFWLFNELEDKKLIAKTRTGSEKSKLIIDASAVFLVTVDERVYTAREFHASGMDAGASIQNMLLCAQSMGLGSCWVNFQSLKLKDQDVLYKAFNIPLYEKIYAIIPIGYSADTPAPPERKNYLEIYSK